MRGAADRRGALRPLGLVIGSGRRAVVPHLGTGRVTAGGPAGGRSLRSSFLETGVRSGARRRAAVFVRPAARVSGHARRCR
ncbi:hypothetical protein Acsp04_17290 [Actinomadura sp. NBRC 104425]|nr:hypothetical protein Acsp04_17290 [Actinomadura sp. NBRC 104425]